MKKHLILLVSICVTALIILFITVANLMGKLGFFFVYNLGYGILLSTLVPVFFMWKGNEGFSSVGVRRLGVRQYAVLMGFVLFSVGGQLIPLLARGVPVRFDLLPICFLPLIMTTFFEVFLFHGFIQTRIERDYGWVVGVLLSGFFFSVYHLGYPGFRRAEDLLLLFVVGMGFALAYKLSGNNLFVAYFVNLPNAFVTYFLKADQFPPFTGLTSVFAGITILIVVIILFFAGKRVKPDFVLVGEVSPCLQKERPL